MNYRSMRLFTALLLLCSLSLAELPDAPRPNVVDKSFLISESVLAAATGWDAYTTVNLRHTCYETNPILGRHPSTAAVAGYMGAQFAASTALNYYAKRKLANTRFGKFAWMLPTFYLSADHAKGAINNYVVNCE